MRVGDKVKFHDYDLWEDSCGISKRSFELEFSYNETYTIDYITDCGENLMVKSVEARGFIHNADHVYVVNTDLPEDLFHV